MPQFIVLRMAGTDVPPMDGTGSADVYRSADVVDAAAAITAAITKMQPPGGTRLWAIPIAQLTRYKTAMTGPLEP